MSKMNFSMWLRPLLPKKERLLIVKAYQNKRISKKSAPYFFWYSLYCLYWEDDPERQEIMYLKALAGLL